MNTGFESTVPYHRAVQALRNEVADLDLTDEERATLAWLERWEAQAIANVASIIEKARAA